MPHNATSLATLTFPGNKYISYLTNAKAYKMVVEMIALDGTYAYAKYSSFKISSAALQYALSVCELNYSMNYFHLKFF